MDKTALLTWLLPFSFLMLKNKVNVLFCGGGFAKICEVNLLCVDGCEEGFILFCNELMDFG